MPTGKHYWLVKSEPDCFSIDDLARSPRQTTCWDGVRNYQACNFMKAMKKGDSVLFYHSSTEPLGIAGTAVVAREAYPDHTALDRSNDHYDPKATAERPIWEMVDIKLDRIFDPPLALDKLRGVTQLAKMELLRRGSRLSVQPVTEQEWKNVMELADRSSKPKTKPRSKQKSEVSRKDAKVAKRSV